MLPLRWKFPKSAPLNMKQIVWTRWYQHTYKRATNFSNTIFPFSLYVSDRMSNFFFCLVSCEENTQNAVDLTFDDEIEFLDLSSDSTMKAKFFRQFNVVGLNSCIHRTPQLEIRLLNFHLHFQHHTNVNKHFSQRL